MDIAIAYRKPEVETFLSATVVASPTFTAAAGSPFEVGTSTDNEPHAVI